MTLKSPILTILDTWCCVNLQNTPFFDEIKLPRIRNPITHLTLMYVCSPSRVEICTLSAGVALFLCWIGPFRIYRFIILLKNTTVCASYIHNLNLPWSVFPLHNFSSGFGTSNWVALTFTGHPSLNIQSCNRRPLYSRFTYKNVCSPKKTVLFQKKILTPKTWNNRSQKLLIIGPQLFLCTDPSAQQPKQPKNRNPAPPKATLCRTGYLDWVSNAVYFYYNKNILG